MSHDDGGLRIRDRSGVDWGDCLNVDIGGGTTKITRCVDGKVTELTAIEVGGRILQFTDEGDVGHAEPNLVCILQETSFLNTALS